MALARRTSRQRSNVAASVARGKTVIQGAQELRIKETDRIRALSVELSRFGVEVREFQDGLEINGRTQAVAASGNSHGDHRIAMSLAVLGTVAQGLTRVEDTDCVKTSFPQFFSFLKKIGGHVSKRG